MRYEPVSKEKIVVAHQSEISVYVGESGYVVIRQENEIDEPSIITISSMNVEAVAKAMKAAVKEAEETRQEYLFGDQDADA